MNQDLTYTIDRYLKGKLSEEEQRALEEKMQQDPLLAHEVTWQKDIYHALGDVRRAALKSRLDNMVVHPSPHFLGQRWLTAAVVGTLLVAGSAYYYAASDEPEPTAHQAIEAPVTYPEAYTLHRIQRDALATVSPEDASSKEAPVPIDEAVNAAPTAFIKARPAQPAVVPPQVTSQFAEDAPVVDYSDFEAPEKSALQENAYREENVTVEALSDSRYTFHYQFFDNKLYLHGNFDQTPYKIIALNSEEDKKLFLEFDGAYYRIGEHEVAVPLVKIEDAALVKSLKNMSAIN